MCLDAIMGQLLEIDNRLEAFGVGDREINVYIGWSNGDVDLDVRAATIDELQDANPGEGTFKHITVHFYPNCSIAR